MCGTQALVATDEELLDRVRQRNEAALETLYDRYGKLVFALAYRMVASREVAEEVTQDAFLSVWRQAATYRESAGRVRPWLLAIAHHRAVDRLRRTRHRPAAASLDEAWMTPSGADVFGEVYDGLQREQVRAALDRLPPAQRQALDLAYYHGCSFVEIAGMTGAPVGTVKSRVRLGVARLKTLLGEAPA